MYNGISKSKSNDCLRRFWYRFAKSMFLIYLFEFYCPVSFYFEIGWSDVKRGWAHTTTMCNIHDIQMEFK